ncbi:MAG: hypothetical protein M0Q47_10170 [Methanothrix sp.]|jgi:hypothetical protein|uniref:hypothetical protein n=1 Tax=Methanothrix sp. TaxID=90426 RepID=UPI0025D024BB|nr:hypothetical protein [Methanothrix sp.]MCK9406757.1 hypothetical protein [Methanothrix sp.]
MNESDGACIAWRYLRSNSYYQDLHQNREKLDFIMANTAFDVEKVNGKGIADRVCSQYCAALPDRGPETTNAG